MMDKKPARILDPETDGIVTDAINALDAAARSASQHGLPDAIINRLGEMALWIVDGYAEICDPKPRSIQ